MDHRQTRRPPPTSRPSLIDQSLARIPWLLVGTCLVVVTLIFTRDLSRHFEFPKYTAFRWIILIALLTWWASHRLQAQLANPLGPPFALWLAGTGLSILAAPNMAECLDVMSFPDALGFYALIFLSSSLIINLRRLIQGICVLIITTLTVAVIGLLQHYGMDPIGLVENNVPISTIGNQNFAAYIHEIGIPIAAGLAAWWALSLRNRGNTMQHGPQRGMKAGLILTGLYLVLGSWHMLACNSFGNRLIMAFVAYAMVWTIVLTGLPWSRSRRIILASAAAGLLVAASLAYAQTAQFSLYWNKRSNVFRREVWTTTLQTIRDNVLAGIGPGNYKIVHALYETDRERAALGPDVLSREAHNDYLDKILEGGILGAAGVFWIVITTMALLLQCFRMARQPPNLPMSGRSPPHDSGCLSTDSRSGYWITLGLAGSIAAVALHALIEVPLYQPASAVLFAFVLGVLAAHHRMLLHRGTPAAAVAREIASYPAWAPPALRWGMAAIAALLLLTPAFRMYLGEAHLRRAIEAHDTFAAFASNGRSADMAYYKERMLRSLERSGEFFPVSLKTWETAGRFCLETGEMERAEEGITRTLHLDPNSKLAHNNHGVSQEKHERWDDARVSFRAALYIDPWQYDALQNLGLNYLHESGNASALGRTDQARSANAMALGYLTLATRVVPVHADAWKYRALAWQALADSAEDPARRQKLERAVRSDLSSYFIHKTELSAPEDVTLLRDLAVLYEDAGEPEGMLRPYERLIESGEATQADTQRLVQIYLRTGRHLKAEEIVQGMIRQTPGDARIRYNLAKILALQGEGRYSDMAAALGEAIRRNKGLAEEARRENAFRRYLSRPEMQDILGRE